MECLDEVWFKHDSKDSGQVSWHQLRPIMEDIVVVEAHLNEERRLWEEKEARRKQEYNDQVNRRNAKLAELEAVRAQRA